MGNSLVLRSFLPPVFDWFQKLEATGNEAKWGSIVIDFSGIHAPTIRIEFQPLTEVLCYRTSNMVMLSKFATE